MLIVFHEALYVQHAAQQIDPLSNSRTFCILLPQDRTILRYTESTFLLSVIVGNCKYSISCCVNSSFSKENRIANISMFTSWLKSAACLRNKGSESVSHEMIMVTSYI